jgi:hypothetical protein
MSAANAGLGSARVSRVGFDVAPEQSFLWISLARCDGNRRQKFAIARTRSPARETRALPGDANP